jgi:hypothetical protein
MLISDHALEYCKRILSMRLQYKIANINPRLQKKKILFSSSESPAQIGFKSVKSNNMKSSNLATFNMQELLFSKYSVLGDFWGTYTVHDVNFLQVNLPQLGQ